jgi:CHAT domain-containing protein
MKAARLAAVAAAAGLALCGRAGAFELPPVCKSASAAPADTSTTPVAELHHRVEALAETDPSTAVSILCATIPRVAAQYGEQSAELGWWVKSLTMPMIAYMDRFAEALPLLAFAQPLLERAYGPQGEELADIHVAYAWIYRRQGRLSDSAMAWRRALAIRERFPGERKVELQKALVGLALTELALGELRDARVRIEQAHAIVVEYHEEVSEAAAAIENVMTNLAFREESFIEAKRHAEAQIAIEKQLSAGIGQLVPGYVFLGQILERLDDFAGSESASREAIRLAEAEHGAPLQRHHLAALTQLAQLLNARDRPQEALPFAQRAVELGEKTLGADAPSLVKVLQSLADAQRALGNLPAAWHLYQRIGVIVDHSKSDVERPVLVAYYRGLAGLQLDLGNLDDAESAIDAGLAATQAEPALALQRAYLLATQAQILAQSDPTAALSRLAEARHLFESRLPRAHPAILRVVNESCALEVETHGPAPSCREAERWVERSGEIEPSLRAAVYANLSELRAAQDHLAASARYAESAVAAAEGVGTPEPLWRAYFRAGTVLRAQGQLGLGVFFGKRALAQIERQRVRFAGEDERFDRGFLRDKIAVYRSVADWLLDAGRIDEAVEVMHLLKAQEFAQFVSRAPPPRSQGPAPALTPQELALEGSYAGVLPQGSTEDAEIDHLSRMADADRITSTERNRLASLARSKRKAEWETARRIQDFVRRNRASHAAAPRTDQPVDAASLRAEIARAPARTAIAYYLLAEHRLRILIATHDSQHEVSVAVDAQSLRRNIGRFLDRISRREDVSADARALYAVVGLPLDAIARREGIARLELWLDGALRYIPFDALRADDGYLVDHYAIRMITREPLTGELASESVPQRASSESLIVRGLGVTRAIAGYPALPGMADELCYVVRGPIAGLEATTPACSEPPERRGALEGEGFADGEFTARRLEDLLRPPHAFTVLHLGTHFSLRPGNVNRSFLLLGDGSRLTLDALSTLDFSGLDIVTLSACQTAVGGGRTDDGREVEGLSALVQQRGARRVVASLWQVEDTSTSELMRVLYARLASGSADATIALRDAQRAVRTYTVNGAHPYSHPYYWAGFVVSGD